ncbi:exodeoxyribonuclease VII large subunit [Treponema phagedenis]|uniref:exodeoxyribonuclease VII large subunit n=1 Tax=Treponema phagedenis TaxID=162 RepID=UPI0001F63CF2|nr:exodeoxyribonuclease VII large subunit [Treponema phagedenis]EFW37561.1 exodeoxyribonuclease VII, large subunit [Treponema phagedenis F0421]TYT79237.1 exodeoxyribonuclease VII large subunit [Treponema phagedenis]
MIKVYSVKEITAEIKALLEGSLSRCTVQGEISNCKPSSTGHLYFALKDDKALLQAVMFKSKLWALNFEPKDGMLVQITGNISVYEQRGSYQIIAEKMQLAGEGDILRLLEERKNKLLREGLFDAEKKKTLPFFPKTIAVITSPTGAAVRDIINVITRRNQKVNILVLPAAVQGAEAAASIIAQLKIVNVHKLASVIIVGRGGGSLEDLLPFSDEQVVRAIAESNIPVISAVGHETDWALSDYVADLRAPTPSAAAELAAPLLDDIINKFTEDREILISLMRARIEHIKLMISGFDPETLEMKFRRIEQPFLLRFDDAKEALLRNFSSRLEKVRHKVNLLQHSIEGANPQTILNRGYAIVRDEQGKTIRDASSVPKRTKLIITPAKGSLEAEVL